MKITLEEFITENKIELDTDLTPAQTQGKQILNLAGVGVIPIKGAGTYLWNKSNTGKALFSSGKDRLILTPKKAIKYLEDRAKAEGIAAGKRLAQLQMRKALGLSDQ